MQHFFLTPDAFRGSEVIFPPEIARQIVHVLRAKPGEHVIVRDGSGRQMEVALVIDGRLVSGNVVTSQIIDREPALKLHLFFALSQRDRVEMILQKCTEVGVAAFTPLITSRTLVQDKSTVAKKKDRWQAIIREAAEQSERNCLPVLHGALSFSEALHTPQENILKILAWEQEQSLTIRAVMAAHTAAQVALMIGPEGGFSEEEARLARIGGWQPVTLGRRILRMETAAIVASALILDSDL